MDDKSMLKLTAAETSTLVDQPESGMGYQFVEGVQYDNQIKRGIVYNAELFFEEQESRDILKSSSYARVLETAPESTGTFKSLRVLSRTEAPNAPSERQVTVAKGAPAKDASLEQTEEDEVFKRFSAVQNDNRLQPDCSWNKGTYATTAADATNVKTGTDAVERYALPNPTPACYVFTGKPDKGTDVKRGVVQPDFGHQGGGVEVIFPNGTQSNTVTGPIQIPAI
jgi:hypothetical protein